MRKLWGEASANFDIAFAAPTDGSPAEIIRMLIGMGRGDYSEVLDFAVQTQLKIKLKFYATFFDRNLPIQT